MIDIQVMNVQWKLPGPDYSLLLAAGSRFAAGRAESALGVSRYSFQTSFISSVDDTGTTRRWRKFRTSVAARLLSLVLAADVDG